MKELIQKGKLAKAAAAQLAVLQSATRKHILMAVAQDLVEKTDYILEENKKDIDEGRKKGMSELLPLPTEFDRFQTFLTLLGKLFQRYAVQMVFASVRCVFPLGFAELSMKLVQM